MPQSRRMRTVERITRSGDVLTIETTHRDPAYYRRPLVVSIPYTSSDFEFCAGATCGPDRCQVVARVSSWG